MNKEYFVEEKLVYIIGYLTIYPDKSLTIKDDMNRDLFLIEKYKFDDLLITYNDGEEDVISLYDYSSLRDVIRYALSQKVL